MDDNEPTVTKTIFNDPDKLKRTKENLKTEFATGTDYNEKMRSMLGLNDPSPNRAKLAKRIVYGQ